MSRRKLELNGIGPWIREHREEANISLRGLAAEIGYDPGFLSKIEQGLAPPPHEFLSKIGELDPFPAAEMWEISGRFIIKWDKIDPDLHTLIRAMLDDGAVHIIIQTGPYKPSGQKVDWPWVAQAAKSLMRHCSKQGNPVDRFPINVSMIAACAGIPISNTNSARDNYRARYDPRLNQIVVNRHYCRGKENERWAIAHELGHACLHALKLIYGRSKKYLHHHTLAKREREAQVFAAELTMPAEMVRRIVSGHMDKLVDPAFRYGLSTRFGCSLAATENRLNDLGLVDRAHIERDKAIPIGKRRKVAQIRYPGLAI